MLLLSTLALALSGGPPLVADVPRGTDLVVRAEVGRLEADGRAMWSELGPVLDGLPMLKTLTERGGAWAQVRNVLESHVGASLTRRDVVVTLVVDIDATGGAAWGAVIRGALRKGKSRAVGGQEAGQKKVETFEVDGHTAYRLPEELAWSVVGDVIVVGDERGMQRQLRHLLAPTTPKDEPIIRYASRLRKRASVSAAFTLSEPVSRSLALMFTNLGPLLEQVKAGSVAVRGPTIDIVLAGKSKQGQEALEHAVRALVAIIRASISLLEGGTEALLGLEVIDKRLGLVPDEIDADTIEKLRSTWLEGFAIEPTIRRRRGHEIEATLEVSSTRGLVAALGVMGIFVLPTIAAHDEGKGEAQSLLKELREAQQAHKVKTGEYMECGPVPAKLPEHSVPWPRGTCFDALGFSPTGRVRFQVIAGVEGGKLVLMARGDPDGDGIPAMWVLEEGATEARRLGPPQ